MFPPDTKELAKGAHRKFIDEIINKSRNRNQNINDALDPEVDKMKTIVEFILAVVADVTEENNRLWIKKLREKGIDI